jgi:hypothetical protein
MTHRSYFEKYFPEEIIQYNLIKDPFTEKLMLNITTIEEEQLIDISSDSLLRIKFSSLSHLGFWKNKR